MSSSSVPTNNDSAPRPVSSVERVIRMDVDVDRSNDFKDNDEHDYTDDDDDDETKNVIKTTMIAKYGKQTITIADLPSHSTTIGMVKKLLMQETNILPKRQKLIGLTSTATATLAVGIPKKTKTTMIDDECTLDKLQIKKPKECIYDEQNPNQLLHAYHTFILMGTPESEIFIDPDDEEFNTSSNGSFVVNDLDLDLNIGSDAFREHFVNRQNLLKFTHSTQVHIMNPPREGKKLMVLDLDHTLLDFSSKKIIGNGNGSINGTSDDAGITTSNGRSVQEVINQMKRPFMDEFLSAMYQHYDLVVWSQTSWRWLETKLVELGMLTNPNYRFCFVLDKTSMFAVTSTRRNGQKIKHYVKPLQIIWTKFPNIWNASNTIHLDDLSRNFALNIDNGLKVTAYYRKKKRSGRGRDGDVELIGLIGYCTKLAREVDDFTNVDFKDWKDVVNGTKELIDTTTTTNTTSTSAGSKGSSSNHEKKEKQDG